MLSSWLRDSVVEFRVRIQGSGFRDEGSGSGVHFCSVWGLGFVYAPSKKLLWGPLTGSTSVCRRIRIWGLRLGVFGGFIV